MALETNRLATSRHCCITVLAPQTRRVQDVSKLNRLFGPTLIYLERTGFIDRRVEVAQTRQSGQSVLAGQRSEDSRSRGNVDFAARWQGCSRSSRLRHSVIGAIYVNSFVDYRRFTSVR